jgi:predicted homoserine dehydrogenase-like protein
MRPLDRELQARADSGRPIQVALVGAGATGRAIARQLLTPVTGIRLAVVVNRTLERARQAWAGSGAEPATLGDSRELEAAIRSGRPAIAESPELLYDTGAIEVVIEATGTIEFAADVTQRCIAAGKHVVLVNAELDSTLGPLLKARADQAGVVYTNTDGDEPGVAFTLLRYLRSLGLRPVAAGNLKGMVDHYRTPDTQRAFAERYGQNARLMTAAADATKLSMEAAVLANASGFRVGKRGMFGPACGNVSEVAALLPAGEMLHGGLVDYALGAAPHTGAFVVIHEADAAKQAQLAYYKLGDGPFYVFHTPYHVPHVQIASTIARAALAGDPTVAPGGGPVCEVVALAKRDLKAGEVLDGVGGFMAYGLVDNVARARADDALPMGLIEGCRLVRDLPRDAVIRSSDVIRPEGRLSDRLWKEQAALWPAEGT